MTSSRGRADRYFFTTWHPYPDENGREGVDGTWLSMSQKLSRRLLPYGAPPETSKLMNVYQLPGGRFGRVVREERSTCLFPTTSAYWQYRRAAGIPDTANPLVIANPYSSLLYTGTCR